MEKCHREKRHREKRHREKRHRLSPIRNVTFLGLTALFCPIVPACGLICPARPRGLKDWGDFAVQTQPAPVPHRVHRLAFPPGLMLG
jgi:hypothetical protein